MGSWPGWDGRSISSAPTDDVFTLRSARRAYELQQAAAPENAHLRAMLMTVRKQVRRRWGGARAWTAMACLTRAAELLESIERDA